MNRARVATSLASCLAFLAPTMVGGEGVSEADKRLGARLAVAAIRQATEGPERRAESALLFLDLLLAPTDDPPGPDVQAGLEDAKAIDSLISLEQRARPETAELACEIRQGIEAWLNW